MDKIADLARLMRQKREEGEHPYVLILGAGASVSSGTSLNRSVVERVIGTYDLREFDAYLTQRSPSERFAILRDLVEGAFPSKGYQCLAELIQKGYFDVILSTNFDPLLEDAIMGLRMRRRDYVFLVHGVMEPELIVEQLDHRVPRVKLLKLHGDLFYRKFYYTGDEIDAFPPQISSALETYLNHRDIVIAGHGMRDSDINRCLKDEGGSIWYVSPDPPSGDIARVMKSRRSEGNVLSGDSGYFDQFFVTLHAALLGGTAGTDVDLVSQVIYSIMRDDGCPIGSGFLLGDTGLLVTDSSILAGLGKGMAPPVTAQVRPFAEVQAGTVTKGHGGGQSRTARLVVSPQAALDYAVFKIEGLIEASPLELADDLPKVGEPVTACISVGESQGFRDGAVTNVNCSVPIKMGRDRIEKIKNLIETDIAVTGGACGSPLIRSDGRIVGAIVAGREGSNQSYALTALRLREMLVSAGLGLAR